jgi:hypothetical protein
VSVYHPGNTTTESHNPPPSKIDRILELYEAQLAELKVFDTIDSSSKPNIMTETDKLLQQASEFLQEDRKISEKETSAKDLVDARVEADQRKPVERVQAEYETCASKGPFGRTGILEVEERKTGKETQKQDIKDAKKELKDMKMDLSHPEPVNKKGNACK